jgi:WD40 repeat protein
MNEPQVWLLLAREQGQGVAIALRAEEPAFGVARQRLDVWGLEADTHLNASLQHGAQLAYELLWHEKLLASEVSAGFELNDQQPRLVVGRSADLALALAFVVNVLGSGRRRFPALAATGTLNANAWVGHVEAVPAKVQAAIDALPAGGLVFLPQADAALLPPELFARAQVKSIQLCPVQRLDEAIELLGIQLEKVYLQNPYMGLHAFEFRHRSIYFGRESEAREAFQKLLNRAAQDKADKAGLLVVGPSGSGKSSFVQAGILNEAHRWASSTGKSLAHAIWRPRDMERGGQDKAAQALLLRSIQNSWRQHPALAGAVDCATLEQLFGGYAALPRETTQFVWVIDQLEELFTQSLPPETFHALAQVMRQLQQNGAWIVATLRSDFYGPYQTQDFLLKTFEGEGTYNLSGIGQVMLREVIVEPARRGGYEFEVDAQGRALAEQIQLDAQGAKDPLPLLEFALSELFRLRDEDKKQLSWSAYEDIGGLSGAVAQRAENCHALLSEPARQALPDLLRQLVHVDADRKVVSRTLVCEPRQLTVARQELIHSFADQQTRLLTLERAGGHAQDIAVRVTHEALLSHWRRAREFIESNAEDLIQQAQLEREAGEWRSRAQAGDLLIPAGQRMQRAHALMARLGQELEAGTREFIEASLAHEQKQKAAAQERRFTLIRRFSMAAGAAVLVMAGVSVFAWRQWQLARENERIAIEQKGETRHQMANQMGRQAAIEFADGNLDKALQFSILGVRIDLGLPDSGSRPSIAAAQLAFILATGGLRRTFAVSVSGGSVAFSPDGARIAVTDGDEVRILDATTGQEMAMIKHPDFKIHSTVAFSADGERIVTSSEDKTARIWDAATGKQMVVLEGHQDRVISARFSPDGKYIVTASLDKTARLWDAASGKQIRLLGTHQDWATSAVFSPDGERVITSSSSHSAPRVFDVETGMEINLWLDEDKLAIDSYSVDISRDGSLILAISSPRYVKVWRSTTGRLIKNFEAAKSDLDSALLSPDGGRIVTVSREDGFRIWDTVTERQIAQLKKVDDGSLLSAAFSPDGMRMATSEKNRVRIWDMATWNPNSMVVFESAKLVNAAAFSPDGTRIVVAFRDGIGHVYDVATKRLIMELKGHKGEIVSAAFSHDGNRIVTASSDMTARIWDAVDGHPMVVLEDLQNKVNSAAFSPDDQLVITNGGKMPRIWDAATGKQIAELKGDDHSEEPSSSPISDRTSAAFSPDGTRIAASGMDFRVRIWNTKTGDLLKRLSGPRTYGVFPISFSPDGARIVAPSMVGTVDIWDAATGRSLMVLAGHDRPVNSAAFSPDGSRIVTASNDDTVRIWDAATGISIAVLKMKDVIRSAAFSPDGTRVVIVGGRAVRIWDVRFATLPAKNLLAEACAQPLLANHKLSRDDMRKFGYPDSRPELDVCNDAP